MDCSPYQTKFRCVEKFVHCFLMFGHECCFEGLLKPSGFESAIRCHSGLQEKHQQLTLLLFPLAWFHPRWHWVNFPLLCGRSGLLTFILVTRWSTTWSHCTIHWSIMWLSLNDHKINSHSSQSTMRVGAQRLGLRIDIDNQSERNANTKARGHLTCIL